MLPIIFIPIKNITIDIDNIKRNFIPDFEFEPKNETKYFFLLKL